MELKIYNPQEGGYLKKIEWNFEELKEEVTAKAKEYAATVYTDETIKAAKADRVMQAGRAPESEQPREMPQKMETVEEPVNVIDFRVYATMAQLMKLKAFLNDNGIRFEPVPKN